MEKWEAALYKFLAPWKDRSDVAGALLCGSYVTGNPSKHSDLDIHIVTKKGTKWRERGNKYVNDFLMEYLVNPPEQIRSYFKEDHGKFQRNAVIQFKTGRMLFDDGTIKSLKQDANKWFAKKFKKRSRVSVEIGKYGIWDTMDDLEDCYEKGAPDFWFPYHTSLSFLIEDYSKFVGYPAIKDKDYKILTDGATRRKYLLPEFPDKEFAAIAAKAIIENDKKAALTSYQKLARHVFKKMGGFEIDGWRCKSPLDLK
jgi:hypothetical protein